MSGSDCRGIKMKSYHLKCCDKMKEALNLSVILGTPLTCDFFLNTCTEKMYLPIIMYCPFCGKEIEKEKGKNK
jgi:hypothetical protein